MAGAEQTPKKITIDFDGAYTVAGNIPLVRKVQIVSEHGEPLAWKKEETLTPADATYQLCRCGHSKEKPFCDSTHFEVGFDGTETADLGPTAERQVTFPGSTRIVVRRDTSLCMESGFCANRLTNLEKMAAQTGDSLVRGQVMAMVHNCPSGSYVFAEQEGGPDVEADLPVQIAVTVELTDAGPIEGPLWVTGGIPIERSDGQMLETRNRVTLCNCGESKNKPLCDGTHRALKERKL